MDSITPQQVAEARAWIADCGWADLTPAKVQRLTRAQVIAGIARHYEVGWAAFIADAA